MLQAFLKFLGGESGEEKTIWLLLGKGFFMGIFLATYTVGAETLFISEMGEGMLEKAFLTGGCLGICSTVVFVYLQRKINYSTLAICVTFFIFIFVAVLRGAYEVYSSPWITFALFVMMGPVSALTTLTFWGVLGRVFSLRAAKRIMGGIDTGQLTATCLAFFSIPGLRILGLINSTTDLLFISLTGAFAVFVFTLVIVKNYNLDIATKRKAKEKPGVGYIDLLKSRYLGLLSLFVVFSTSANIFAGFTFYSSVEVMYPDEAELSNFLSFYDGAIILLSFIIQSFVNSFIIGRYGLKVSLMVMPIVLGGFTLGAIVSGHIFGFAVKDKEYLLFFLFTGMARLLTAALRDALENPAFKLFFLPLDPKVRFDIQSRIEGVVNEFAALVAGAVLIGMGFLSFFKLIHLSYIIVLLASVVVYLAARLYDEYKGTLKITLMRQKEALGNKGIKNENNTVNVLLRELNEPNPGGVILAMKLFERLEPILFRSAIIDLLKCPFPEVRKYVYIKCRQMNNFEKLAEIRELAANEKEEELKNLADETVGFLQKSDDFELDKVPIRKLSRSIATENRVMAAQLLAKVGDASCIPFLTELLHDINPKVRLAAISSTGIAGWPELWPVLIENLERPTYSNAAKSALIAVGRPAYYAVDATFYKTGQQKATMFRVIQILGRIKGAEGTKRLWKKIDFPDKTIVSEILLSLSYAGYQAKESQAARIRIQIESEIGNIAWNTKALLDMPEETKTDTMLRKALKEENKRSYDDIYILMSLMYDAQAVQLVKENINAGTSESTTLAVEMIDIFLDGSLKRKAFPVFDEMKPEERLRMLSNYYAPEEFEDYEDLLLAIVNRDYNRVNRWTKAIAIYRLAELDSTNVPPNLIANLFNPDFLLLQTSAWAIYKKDPHAYEQNMQRIKPELKKDIDKTIVPPAFAQAREDRHRNTLLIERALFIKNLPLFEMIPGLVITDLVDVTEQVRIKAGQTFIEEGETGRNIPLYIILEGEVALLQRNGTMLKVMRHGEVIGVDKLVSTDLFNCNYTALTHTTCLTISKDSFFDLMSKNIEMVEAMLLTVKADEYKKQEEEAIDGERLLRFG